MTDIESNLDPETVNSVRAVAAKPAPSTEQAVRNRIAATHGLSEDVRDLFLLGTDEDQLDRTAAALVARGIVGPIPARSDLVVPSEGSTRDNTSKADREARDFARDLFSD